MNFAQKLLMLDRYGSYYKNVLFTGKTYTNRASWGGCESTDGWTTSDIDLSAVGSVQFEGTNCLKMAVAAGKSSGYIRRDILADLDITKYYLLSAYVKNVDATNIQFSADCVGDAGAVAATAVEGTTYTRSGVVIQPTDFDTATQVYFTLTTTGEATKYTLVDACMPVEISAAEYALGAAAVMDMYPFVLGTKSTAPSEIVATGKNLFDKYAVINGKYISYITGNLFNLATSSVSDYIRVLPSSTYRLAINGGGSNGLVFFDINKTYLYGKSLSGWGTTVTTTADTAYLRMSVYNAHLDTQMLEYGTEQTTYAPYQSTKSYTPILHSVPAIADTFDCVTGVHTVNTALDSDISGTDFVSITKTYTNYDFIIITAFTLAKAGLNGVIDGITRLFDKSGVELTEIASLAGDDIANVGKYTYDVNNRLNIIVPKDLYADIADARTGLGTMSCRYQLATPTVTQETATGMASLASGTVTQDNIIKDGGTYSGGLTITDSTYPIVTLAEVYKTASGTNTQITLASCTVAGDGLSFTSTELNNGDVVTYRYYRSPFYTIGTIGVT